MALMIACLPVLITSGSPPLWLIRALWLLSTFICPASSSCAFLYNITWRPDQNFNALIDSSLSNDTYNFGGSAAVECNNMGLEYVCGDNATRSAKDASISTSACAYKKVDWYVRLHLRKYLESSIYKAKIFLPHCPSARIKHPFWHGRCPLVKIEVLQKFSLISRCLHFTLHIYIRNHDDQ